MSPFQTPKLGKTNEAVKTVGAIEAVDTEVIVIGAGPAGIAAGLALTNLGVPCLLVDSQMPPIDKACGEGLMPDAIQSLARLGVTLEQNQPQQADQSLCGFPFAGICFKDERHLVAASFPNGHGIGIRRTKLHELLFKEALKVGIEIIWGGRVELDPLEGERTAQEGKTSPASRSKRTHCLRINGRKLRCHYIVGADGQASSVRRWAQLDGVIKLETRYGFRQHFNIAPWNEHVEITWAECGQIYVTPVSNNEVGVALLTRHPKLRLTEALAQFPCLYQRLSQAEATTTERGSISTTRKLRRVASRTVALIGDASGSVDAITGDGMAISFRQALALASAIKQNDLSIYQKEHAEINKLPASMASLLLLMDRFPFLRRQVLAIMSSHSVLLERLLSLHVTGRHRQPVWL